MTEKELNQPKYLESLERFRGKTLVDILPQISLTLGGKTSLALKTLEQSLQEIGILDGVIFELARRHWEGESIRSLERQLSLGSRAIRNVFIELDIPMRTQAEAVRINNQDPQFKEKNSSASRANLAKLKQDPEFRRRSVAATRAMLAKKWQDLDFRRSASQRQIAAWQDPEYRQTRTEEFQARQQDPEFRKKQIEAVKANWQNPDFRRRQSEAARTELSERWQDPQFRQKRSQALRDKWLDSDFRRRQKAGVERLWQDAEFRVRNAEAVRQARLNPANLGRYVLPTIYGERWDTGFTQSTWEANLARVILYSGREYLIHEPLRLENDSLFELDFLTLDNRYRWVGYEIMAHPLENPEGWEKLERAILEYPNIYFQIIDERFYERLKRMFADRINSDTRFAGWEEKDDNLRDNPQKYT